VDGRKDSGYSASSAGETAKEALIKKSVFGKKVPFFTL
jgi:hypothetical protein